MAKALSAGIIYEPISAVRGTLYMLSVLYWRAAHFEIRPLVSDKLRRFLQIKDKVVYFAAQFHETGVYQLPFSRIRKEQNTMKIALLIYRQWNLSFLTAVPTHANSDTGVPCCASSSLHSFLSLRKPSMTDTWARICADSLALSWRKKKEGRKTSIQNGKLSSRENIDTILLLRCLSTVIQLSIFQRSRPSRPKGGYIADNALDKSISTP